MVIVQPVIVGASETITYFSERRLPPLKLIVQLVKLPLFLTTKGPELDIAPALNVMSASIYPIGPNTLFQPGIVPLNVDSDDVSILIVPSEPM